MTRLTPTPLGVAALWLTLSAPSALAGELSPSSPAPLAVQDADLAGEVEDIIDEFNEAQAAFYKLMQSATTDEERSKLWEESRPDYDGFAARLKSIVERAPADPAAATAIAWIFGNSDTRETAAGYLAILLEHHIDSDDLGGICLGLSSGAPSEQFLRTVREKSESRGNVGRATYALATLLGDRVSLKRSLSTASEEDLQSYTEWLGEETVALIQSVDVESAGRERRALLEEVREKYKDIAFYGDKTLADRAASVLFELDHLQVGMVAPEISGPDLDGIEFKLTDYRGQVVFLDFWGDW
jgi:hypothetical protein